MGTAIQADLQEVGLTAEIETYEWEHLPRPGERPGPRRGKANMAQMAWMTNANPDTLPYLALRTEAMPDAGGLQLRLLLQHPRWSALLEAGPHRHLTRASARASTGEMQVIVRKTPPGCSSAKLEAERGDLRRRSADFALQPSFFHAAART